MLISIFLGGASYGSLAINSLGTTTTIDFTGFAGVGFSPSPSVEQLDSDIWRVEGLSDGNGTFGGTHTSGDFARGSDGDGVTTGGIYAFDVGSENITLGVQPGESDFTPGAYTLKLGNNTGEMITELSISYDVFVLNNADRSNSFNFSHSADDSGYMAVGSLDFASSEAADTLPSWSGTTLTATLTGLNIANGASYYLQWTGDDAGGSGSRDEFSLDNINIEAVPEPATLAMLGIGGLLTLTIRRLAFS